MTESESDFFQVLAKNRIIVSPTFGPMELDFLHVSKPHSCVYLPGLMAQEQFFFSSRLHPEFYHDLMDNGFRRSGLLFYRPICPECSECRPIRVPVQNFLFSKSFRRVLRKNQDVEIRIQKPRLTEEKNRLYQAYLQGQHHVVVPPKATETKEFLYTTGVNTIEFEYRMRGKLVAAAIGDVSKRSFSSVYAYYDPGMGSRSLGTFSALQEILFCQQQGIPYYYLGFYIAGCASMSYKARFKPYEILTTDFVWESSVTYEHGKRDTACVW